MALIQLPIPASTVRSASSSRSRGSWSWIAAANPGPPNQRHHPSSKEAPLGNVGRISTSPEQRAGRRLTGAATRSPPRQRGAQMTKPTAPDRLRRSWLGQRGAAKSSVSEGEFAALADRPQLFGRERARAAEQPLRQRRRARRIAADSGRGRHRQVGPAGRGQATRGQPQLFSEEVRAAFRPLR